MNTEKVKISPLYLTLIRQLHQDKVEINDRKIARLGSIDIDDQVLSTSRNSILNRRCVKTVWCTAVR